MTYCSSLCERADLASPVEHFSRCNVMSRNPPSPSSSRGPPFIHPNRPAPCRRFAFHGKLRHPPARKAGWPPTESSTRTRSRARPTRQQTIQFRGGMKARVNRGSNQHPGKRGPLDEPTVNSFRPEDCHPEAAGGFSLRRRCRPARVLHRAECHPGSPTPHRASRRGHSGSRPTSWRTSHGRADAALAIGDGRFVTTIPASSSSAWIWSAGRNLRVSSWGNRSAPTRGDERSDMPRTLVAPVVRAVPFSIRARIQYLAGRRVACFSFNICGRGVHPGWGVAVKVAGLGLVAWNVTGDSLSAAVASRR